MDQRFEREAVASNERPCSDGTTELVSGEGHEIDGENIEIDRNLAHGLHRIGMNQRATSVDNPSDLAQGFDHARLVVGEHDRDQRPRSAAKHPVEGIEIEDAVPIDRYRLDG